MFVFDIQIHDFVRNLYSRINFKKWHWEHPCKKLGTLIKGLIGIKKWLAVGVAALKGDITLWKLRNFTAAIFFAKIASKQRFTKELYTKELYYRLI